ncbi:MAG TPA: hypothetical protein VGL35_01710 [Rhizomicrobium sp.]|jgi:translation elongation factor EF-Tu-like GTPase
MTDNSKWKFKARLYLLPTDRGGRKTAFKAGGSLYRPQFYLESPDFSTSCFIDRIDGKSEMAPGESGIVEMRLLKPELFAGQIEPGTKFKIREVADPIGWGIIMEVR